MDAITSGAVVAFLAGIALSIIGPEVPPGIGWGVFAIAGVLGAASLVRHRGTRLTPAIGIIVSAIALIGFVLWYIHDQNLSKPSTATTAGTPTGRTSPIRAEVSEAQFAELTQLSNFIGKDENGLRDTFDFMQVLHRNIAVQSIRIRFRNAGKLDEFLYNNYTEGDGSWIFIAMPGKYHVTPSGVHVDAGPRDVCFLVTTAQYQSAQRTISEFINSPLIPESIRDDLKSYKHVVDSDYERMAYTLDKFMKQGDDFFLKSQDYGGPYYGVIQSDYFSSSFTLLKSKADVVVRDIAKYLGTN